MAPVAGIIGSLQALEVIKKITELDNENDDRILKEFNFK